MPINDSDIDEKNVSSIPEHTISEHHHDYSADQDEETTHEENITSHLIELRQRIIYILIGVLGIFLLLLPFSQTLFEQFAQPVLQSLAANENLIIRKPLDSFLIPLKLCLFLGIIFSLPWILYQVWGFVAPGLYKNERKIIAPLIISTTLLFYMGVLFAYFVVLPLAFQFLAGFAPDGTEYGPDIADYFSFVFTVFFAFGLAFEVPVATVLMVLVGVTDVDSLRSKRRYIIVGAFVFGMLLTPPDIISQTLLAIPMWALFEIGLFVAAQLEKKIADDRDADIKEITQNATDDNSE
ncbi:MAG: twin-arginine translocase subunit TatC [Gammaproteobacteria bacterium]|nr:twin-arginine translocase subunit TatC [Gammaproteobacteria bacterium]